ncbi:MAG: tetratricopeptide repeat protein [Thermoanaerobaculia bacterium]
MSMVDVGGYSDDQLVRDAREALRLRHYSRASGFYCEYCERQVKMAKPISPSVLAGYGLALGHTGRSKEGLEICFQALFVDRRNPDVYWGLADLYWLSRSRRKAIDAIDRGLSLSPGHPGLNRLRDEMGVRRSPPIPFLSRNSVVNMRLGKMIHKLRSTRVSPG